MARGWFVGMLATKSERTGRILAPQTCKNILNLVRCAFEDARSDELVDANVFRDLRLPRGREARRDEPWTVLYPHEQQALFRVAPNDERHIIGFAMGTGMREGELWALRTADVASSGPDPHIVIRDGGFVENAFLPTKRGKPRRIPLFGLALYAIRAWLETLPTYAPINPLALVFPLRDGAHRPLKPPCGWLRWLSAAGVVRHVRWHDLRHTCASSLVAGWWGRAWSLEEVCALLGHSSVRTTERYAHFADDFLTRAADEADSTRRGKTG